MRLRLICALLFAVLAAFISNGFCFVRGDVNLDDKVGLEEAVNALQVSAGLKTPFSSMVLNVPSNDFSTIQAAVNAAKEGDTISIAAGTYNENLVISNKRVKLLGAGPATVVNGGTQTSHAISADKASVWIQNLKITGGNHGIYASAAAVWVESVTVEDTGACGIRVSGQSIATIVDTSTLRSGDHGIAVFLGSVVVLQGVATQSNVNDGLYVEFNSTGMINGTFSSSTNGGYGIRVANASSLLSSGATVNIKGNTLDGVLFAGGSFSTSDKYGENWIIEDGKARGLSLVGSVRAYISQKSTLTSRNNADRGVHIIETSSLQINGTLVSSGNRDIGVGIGLSSSLLNRGVLTASGTTTGAGGGIIFYDSSSLICNSGATVTCENNSGVGIGVARNSSAMLDSSCASVSIKSNGTDGINLNGGNGYINIGEISGNGRDGIFVGLNGSASLNGVTVQNNGRYGLNAERCAIDLRNCTMTGNTVQDMNLYFGAQVISGTWDGTQWIPGSGGTIGKSFCLDESVRLWGDRSCP